MLSKLITTYTIILFLLAFMIAPQPSKADGNKLLKACTAGLKVINKDKGLPSNEYVDAAFCAGLIQGVIGTNRIYQMSGTRPFFCIPEEMSNKAQNTRTVVQYLTAHPEKLELHEATLIIEALSEAFPCR